MPHANSEGITIEFVQKLQIHRPSVMYLCTSCAKWLPSLHDQPLATHEGQSDNQHLAVIETVLSKASCNTRVIETVTKASAEARPQWLMWKFALWVQILLYWELGSHNL